MSTEFESVLPTTTLNIKVHHLLAHRSAQEVQVESKDAKMHEPPTAPAAMITANKRRPKIDLTVLSGERKRGKSMFGIVLGTLNKAKIEDKERNASDAVRPFSSAHLPFI